MSRRDATRNGQIIADALGGLGVQALAEKYHLSPRTIYAVLRGTGCTQVRRRRRDAGLTRSGVPRVTWDALVKLIHHNGYGTEEAIRICRAQMPPLPGADTLTAGWVNDQLRQLGATKRDLARTGPSAFVRRERTRANICHQADATPICLYYLDLRHDLMYEPDNPLHKQRRDQGKTRIHVFGLVDEHSRAIYLRAYAGGETQENWLDFFYHAWSRKQDLGARFPFCGMPRMLYADMGSGLIGRTTSRALREVGIEAIAHVAGKPWKKGKIERACQTFQRLCEPELRDRTFHSLDDLNLWLEEKCLYLNNRIHDATGEPPFARWTRSMREQGLGVTEPPPRDQWERLSLREEENVLVRRDFTIAFGGERIELPRTDLVMAYLGQKIRVLYRPHGGADEPVLAILPPLAALGLAGCELRLERVRPGARPAGWANESNLVTPGRLRILQSLEAETPEMDLAAHHRAAVRDWPVIETGRRATVVNDDLFLAHPLSQVQAIGLGQQRGVLAMPIVDSAADMAWIEQVVPAGSTIDEAEFERLLAEYARSKRHALTDSPAATSRPA